MIHHPLWRRGMGAAIGLALALGAGCQDSLRPTVALGTYHASPSYGYRIQVPIGWQRNLKPRPGYDLEFRGTDGASYTPTLRVLVEKQQIKPNAAMLEGFQAALAQTYEASYSGYDLLWSRQARIHGRLGVQISSRYTLGDRAYQNLETFVFVGDKRFRIVLTALADDFAALARAAESTAATFEVFRDAPYVEPATRKEFEIEPPKGWRLFRQKIPGLAVIYAEAEPGGDFASNLSVEVHEAEGPASSPQIDATTAQIKAAFKARLPSLEFLAESRPAVAGCPGLRLVSTAREKYGDLVRHQTWVFAEKRQFVITFTCLAAAYPALQKEFDESVAGFKIVQTPSGAAERSGSK